MTYQYEPERRRLQHLTATTAKNRSIMNNTYGYDAVDNIMSLTNAAAMANPNQQGGPASYSYQYDDLYRLVSSTGRFQNGSGHVHTYDFGMEYSASGNILKKNQQHQVKGTAQGKTSYAFAYAYEGDKPHAASTIGDSRYSYDLNGNPTLIAETSRNQERRMAWDEENRLLALADNGKTFHYMYDAGGERVLKGKGDGQFVSVNGFNPAGVGFTGNYSMYVNSFLVVNGSRYTKHFYIESQRIVSKISERSIDKELSEPKVGGNGGVDYEKKHKLSKEALYAAYIAAGMQPEIPTAGNSGKIPYGQLKKYFEGNGNNGNNGNNGSGSNGNSGTGSTGKFENLQFFYHPDHIGSSNYVTDVSGEVYQHNEYFPYGETFIEERNNTEYTNYLFSGKELDVETGLYNFGARYQDPRTSVFLNIDPKVDKYPGLSPYMYCAGNPVKYLDPDGQDVKIAIDHNKKTVTISAVIILVPVSGESGRGIGRDVADTYKKSIMDAWSKDSNGKDWQYEHNGNKYTVKFDVDVRMQTLQEAKDKERINNGENNYIDVTRVPVRSNVKNANRGLWFKGTKEGNSAAHEFGHLAGLDDRYVDIKDKNGKVIGYETDNGWGDNIMGKKDGKVEQRNINSILKAAFGSGKSLFLITLVIWKK